MASRIVLGIVIIVLLGGVGYFAVNYRFEPHYENGKLAYVKIVPRSNAPMQPTSVEPSRETPVEINRPPVRPNLTSIRMATYNLAGFDEGKLNSPRINEVLVRFIPQFDLLAVQGLRGKNLSVPARLVEQVNAASGRQYEFVTCPTQKRDGIAHYSGFFYDKSSLETDKTTVRFVEDSMNRFLHKPLVGWFRTRVPSGAFTFYAIAVDTSPDKVEVELGLLAEVFRAVRDNGQNEDDVIMLGDFQADEKHLGSLGKVAGIVPVIFDLPTTIGNIQSVDNILFDRRATIEFTGRADVLDMMRQFDLTIQAAGEISEHLPIWAEFSAFEGGK